MATQPGEVPADRPAEVPVPPSEPGEPVTPPETEPDAPDFDQPDTGPEELPQVD